jgi:hypothetical protein
LLLDAIGCNKTAEVVGQSLAVASALQKVALSPSEKEEVKSNIFAITSTFYNQINRMEENYTRSYSEAWRVGDKQAMEKIQAVKEAELSTLYQGVELLVKCWNLGRKDEVGVAKSQLPLVKEALMKVRLDSKDARLKEKAGELVDKVERFFPDEIKEVKECFVGSTR